MKAHAYAGSADRSARDQLIVEHVPMARRIARRIGRNADQATRDDLEATAMMGLVEAANRYDFSRAEPFPAFAYRRVRGAVIDSMRKNDTVTRRVRSLVKSAGSAIAKLEHELGRTPEDEEIAAVLDMPVEEYREEMAAVTEVSFVELSAKNSDLAIDESADPSQRIERAQLLREVRKGLGKLEPRDARLLSLYYVEELTYSEIARLLEISEPRVCQLHSRALVRLRAAMKEEET
jgi:RNA polymerase sigma factor for flagellar operon FliA